MTTLLLIATLAHHSFAAEFDQNKTIVPKGAVTKVEWFKPQRFKDYAHLRSLLLKEAVDRLAEVGALPVFLSQRRPKVEGQQIKI